MKKESITLACGISAERSFYRGEESLEIDISDLYYPSTPLNPQFMRYAALFAELAAEGYSSHGMYADTDCYGSIDGMTLTVHRKQRK